MATTYGYGGEFSSDEDIDKMEQQSERLVQSKFDSAFAQIKPTRHQIEEAIETIRLLPLEQDVNISDELLAGLLDHYKTQRGPIVDSTRNLYKKIILRLVRGEQQQQQAAPTAADSSVPKDGTNGNGTSNNNSINNIIQKKQQPVAIELASSDEDEPMPPVSNQGLVVDPSSKRRFANLAVNPTHVEPMEVDSETPIGGIRISKQVDLSSTEDEDEEEDKDEEEEEDSESSSSTSSDDTSDSEVTDVTPIKSAAPGAPAKSVGPIVTHKTIDSIKKITPAGLPKILIDPKKKPYTRSQRIAATRSSSSSTSSPAVAKTDVSSSKSDPTASDGSKSLNKRTQSSKFKVRYLVSALLIAALAFFLYYFRSDLTKSTDRILSRAIKF